MKREEIAEMLGEPPWNGELILKCYFRYPDTGEYIKYNHPASEVHSKLESIKLSLDIFVNAVTDLLSQINHFKGESARPEFWHRPYKQIVENLEISIQRSIVSSAMCAMALVRHTSAMKAKFGVADDYDNKLLEYFGDSGSNRFVHDLRNYFAHSRITKADWKITSSKEGRYVFFLLNPTDLDKYTKWDSMSKKFISSNPQGINVEELFESYVKAEVGFYGWLTGYLLDEYGHDVSDYLRSLRIIKKFSAESQWRLLITQYINRNVNPYMYLGQFLTNDEIERVMSLPYRSKEQVDAIIQMFDEYDACSDQLRELVYQLFKVRIPTDLH